MNFHLPQLTALLNTPPQLTLNEAPNSELEALQMELWDLYKDAFGGRPRHLTQEEWQDINFLRKLQQRCLEQLRADNNTN